MIRERTIDDAPAHYHYDEAEAWVSGFHAGADMVVPLIVILKEVLATPMAAPWLEANGGIYGRIKEVIKEFEN